MKANKTPFDKIVNRALNFFEYSLNPGDDCPFFPDHVHIEPTNACNLSCVHCHQSSRGAHFTKKLGMMPLDLFKKVIDEIKDVSSRITLNQQGEPLLNKAILEMVAYAKRAGLSVSMLTNATRLTSEISEALLDLRLDRIVFSFEGSTPQIYEKIRRNAHYFESLNNILYFVARNYEKGRHTFICMSMVKSSYSADDVQAYKDYFSALPINTIFINPLLSMSGAALTSDEVDMDQYKDLPKEDIPVCRLPWESIVVNWDGSVSPCAVDYNESHIIGDANKQNLIDIFNSEPMKRFRRCHLNRDYSWIEEQGPLCVSCNCRFNPEYDLENLKEFTRNYIVRQAKVFAPQLMTVDVQSSDDDAQKYRFLLSEKQKIADLLNQADKRRETDKQ